MVRAYMFKTEGGGSIYLGGGGLCTWGGGLCTQAHALQDLIRSGVRLNQIRCFFVFGACV